MLDPIITMNAAGFIQSASDSVEELFGWTPVELFGQNVNVLIPEPRRSALDRYLDRYRRADNPSTLRRARRFEAVRKDGQPIQIELSMSRADLPMHGSAYFIGIIRDVTLNVDEGDQSPSERSRFQQLITEQTRALATANLRLQLMDRMASLGTLAAGLGHDMNNLLLPVRARLNAIEHSGVSEAALEHVQAVRRSVAYLQHLSDGLHFLTIDPNIPALLNDADGQTHLARWWEQVGTLLRKVVPVNVRVEARLPALLPVVRISPHWLTQAMLNLIVNAGEAIPEKKRGGRVRIGAELSPDHQFVCVTVSDNGRGMTAAVQRRASDMFYTTKARTLGTGLGLPLARKVVTRAGGTMEIRSSPRRGTTVVVCLPIVGPTIFESGVPQSKAIRAVICVKHHRRAALVSQILIAAGVRIVKPEDRNSGACDLCIMEPGPSSLARAAKWPAQTGRVLVLLGAPAKSVRQAWKAFNPLIIDPPDDFVTIRQVIAVALDPRGASPEDRRK